MRKSSIEVTQTLEEALELARRFLSANQFHVIGQCDLKSALKSGWDEDIAPVTLLSVFHGPSVSGLDSHKERMRHLPAYTANVVFSTGKNPGLTTVEMICARGKKRFAIEGGDNVASTVRRAARSVLKDFEDHHKKSVS